MVKIAVSKCLLGDRVRYDGTDCFCEQIKLLNDNETTIIPFCPEMSIGMGVPRGPIQLVLIDAEIKARRVNNSGEDFTKQLKQYAKEFAELHPDLYAIINKKGSPSCGFKSTKLYQNKVLLHSHANGIFLNEIIKLLPGLISIDEQGLNEPAKLKQFIMDIKKAF